MTASKARLGVLVASVRETRAGKPVADWFMPIAEAHPAFEPVLLDLKAWALPILSEPKHPRLQEYTQETTKRWAAAVSACDAFVFVTPEYNFGTPPALSNALDHLLHEWAYKPAGFVSYGGVSAGLRSVQMTKQILSALKVVAIPEAVSIPFIGRQIADGKYSGDETQAKAAAKMLDELAKWTSALATLRST